MPRRDDIESILLIGSGPIVIGQACEFDYSGTQGAKALKEEGYRIILVNSNPATIMTDPEFADRTYVEPLTPEVLEAIIEREKPDAILPTLGGQTALNLALALADRGILEKHGVELIGANVGAIRKAEERELFKAAMDKIGLESARAEVARTIEEANAAAERIGFPIILRPSLTMGGSGGGVAYNKAEFDEAIRWAFQCSPIHECLVEESLIGWKEYELEVIRDNADNFGVICTIENFDPMGVHTGDSITVAPAMTLTDREYQRLRDAARAIITEIGVETGGSNIQFSVNPADGRVIVIEMNPACLAFECARLEGHGLSDRQDRSQARRRLPARRASKRHHRDERCLRADHRLRRHQDSSLRIREVRRRRPPPHDANEIGRRSDGDRAHLQGVPSKGGALARDGQRRPDLAPRQGRLSRPRRAGAPAHRERARPSTRQSRCWPSCPMPPTRSFANRFSTSFERLWPTGSGTSPTGFESGSASTTSTERRKSMSGSSNRCASSSPSSST